MKKFLSTLITLACLFHMAASAQEYSFKYGKITDDELRMTAYAPDPDAEAVFIYDDTYIHYVFANSIQLELERSVKIKILKDAGTRWGDVEIIYHNQQAYRESISKLDAAAYNLVDGKVVKTPLKKQQIFTEELSENTQRMKFSIPDIHAGTVIEYRYRLTSDFIGSIPDIDIQHSIPVIHSTTEVTIPEYFTHHIQTKGYLSLPVTQSSESEPFIGSGGAYYSATKYECDIDDVPALKSEPHIWYLDDFRSGIQFEINGINIPGQLFEDFTTTWSKVNESLQRSEFGRYLSIRNPYRDEVAAIVAGTDNPLQRIHEILKLVQSRIKWDNIYRLVPKRSPHAAAEEGLGDSGSINCILAAALRDAGFQPQVILLNPRSYGRLPMTHATSIIGTFILRVPLENNSMVYLDATNPHADINTLPTDLLVDRARIYGMNDTATGWIDISSIAPSMVFSQISARLTEEGTLECTETDTETYQSAYSLSSRYASSGSHEAFVEKYEQESDISISELTVEGLNSAKAVMKLSFTKNVDTAGGLVYLCPTVSPFLKENPFTTENRKLPVEFPYPHRYRIITTISLPEGYTVEELPKPTRMIACDNGLSCKLNFQQQGSVIQCLFEFEMKHAIFPATQYKDLSAFYGFLTDLCNSQIVIKKP